MRPIRLVIEGVNSFTDAQELDFDAVGRSNLFCISGKTGAGKTTIFDSIMLALYGRCGRGNLGEVVNLSRKTARVVFEFSEGADVYAVERVIAKKSDKAATASDLGAQGSTKELSVSKNGELIGSGGAAAEIIAGVVGLDESEFKTVYLLEQGKYSDFLKLSPKDQSEAVGKIFSLMRFGEISKKASERERAEKEKIEGFDKAIAENSDATPEAVAAAKTELSTLRAKNTALEKELETRKAELKDLEKSRDAYISAESKIKAVMLQEKQLLDAKSARDDAERKLNEFDAAHAGTQQKHDALDALRTKLNELNGLSTLDREYAVATAEVSQKAQDSEKTRAQANKASERQTAAAGEAENTYALFDAQLSAFALSAETSLSAQSDALAGALGSFEDVDRNKRINAVSAAAYALNDELNNYDRLCADRDKAVKRRDIAKANCDGILDKIKRYTDELKAIAEQKAAAEKAVSEAEKALTAARIGSHAAAVKSELHDGDVCPVCGGTYRDGACVAEGNDENVTARKAELEEAQASFKAIEKREADGNKHTDLAKAEYEREDKTVRECDGELKEIEEKLQATRVDKDIYAGLLNALKSAQSLGAEYRQAADEIAGLANKATELTAQAKAAEAAAAEAAKKADEYKLRLGDACGKTEGEITKVKAEIAALEAEIKSVEDEKTALIAAHDKAKSAVEALEKSLVAARAECPVDMPQFDEDAYREKRGIADEKEKTRGEYNTEIAIRALQLEQLEAKSVTLAQTLAERAGAVKRADTYKDLYDLTRANKMLNFVAAEYIEEFTAIASDILGDMSGGKYSMRYDKIGGFVVTDYLNGGKARRTDTLSGGETFLASLAVAIAIARAQSKGDNAFFFLDEGFGTLDEDLIDTVYAALETLSKDCLVGVISHSNALIGLMPACVTVDEATELVGSKIRF